MKKTLVLALALIIAVAGIAFAAVDNTDHDLAVGNNEICAACHTPHGAAGNIYGPLWNRTQAGLATGYTFYSNSTFDMSVVGAGMNLGPQSLACMTCHNGVGSALVNAPGPGGGTGNPIVLIGDGNTIGTQDFTDLTKDLSDDHPVGFEYDNTVTVAGEFPAAAVLTGGTTTSGTTYPLYNGNRFECATCHDVHNTAGVGDGTNEVYFLRVSNANSAMCMDCHLTK